MKTFLKLREQLAIILVEWTKPLYVRLFKQRRKAWGQSIASLKRYPPASLGRALGSFLEQHNFKLLPKLEDHDVLHVLLQYQTTIVGEIRMQYFLLGNRKRSFYACFTALVGVLLVPEELKSYSQAFQKGRQCISISQWNFEHLLSEPLELLQQQIFGKKLTYPPFRI